MKSILMEIQPSIIKYANILSKVLKVEIEIVDSNFTRVAGTGLYKKMINVSMGKEGFTYKNAIETGKIQVIENPGKNPLCKRCIKKDGCEEKYEISTPIKLGFETIGVIGIICSNDLQKEHMLKDFKTYMEFLQQISEFISITAYERKEKLREQALVKSLNQVIDKIDKGVIILNLSDKVTHINKKAVDILKFSDINFKNSISIQETGSVKPEMNEYELCIGSHNFNVKGNIYPVGLNEDQFDRVLIFEKNENPCATNFFSSSYENICIDDILGKSDNIINLKKNIKRISMSLSNVLITGESGTGKELFARAIHNEGNRKDGPFIAVNCAAIPYELLESEMFGYVKGAFTGALSSGKIGKFEMANNGTIFLDEIGDMPMALQIKILRVLQDHRIIKVGSNNPVNINVRVIAATNNDLIKLIKQNKFREDLYYRLNVIPLQIPPLRDRIEDIMELVDYFIRKYAAVLSKDSTPIKIDKDVLEAFYRYRWPGNVRELENTIEYIINMIDGDLITFDMIPENIVKNIEKGLDTEEEIRSLYEVEKNEIMKALKKYGNNTEGKKMASRKLGIGIATLYRKIDEYKLSK